MLQVQQRGRDRHQRHQPAAAGQQQMQPQAAALQGGDQFVDGVPDRIGVGGVAHISQRTVLTHNRHAAQMDRPVTVTVARERLGQPAICLPIAARPSE